MLVVVQAVAQLPPPGELGATDDPRYCGEPAREALKDGQTTLPKIKRSRAVLRHFVAIFPCPSTLEKSYSCPGFAIDHTIPLSMGGCDSQVNLTWLPDLIKSCASPECKDRWERKYHALPRQAVPMNGKDPALKQDEVFSDN